MNPILARGTSLGSDNDLVIGKGEGNLTLTSSGGTTISGGEITIDGNNQLLLKSNSGSIEIQSEDSSNWGFTSYLSTEGFQIWDGTGGGKIAEVGRLKRGDGIVISGGSLMETMPDNIQSLSMGGGIYFKSADNKIIVPTGTSGTLALTSDIPDIKYLHKVYVNAATDHAYFYIDLMSSSPTAIDNYDFESFIDMVVSNFGEGGFFPCTGYFAANGTNNTVYPVVRGTANSKKVTKSEGVLVVYYCTPDGLESTSTITGGEGTPITDHVISFTA